MMNLADPDIHLFLDDEDIELCEGLERVVHHPNPTAEPVVRPDRPWEGSCVMAFGSVFKDPHAGKYRMWYQTLNECLARTEDREHVCYAESEDGLVWEKPSLGICDVLGSRDNNIVLPGVRGKLGHPGVMINPLSQADASRYLTCAYVHKPNDPAGNVYGIWGGTSPDGLQWDLGGKPLFRAGDRNHMVWDPVQRQFLLTTRSPETWYDATREAMSQKKLRTPHRDVCLYTSKDFQTWNKHGQVMVDDDWDETDVQYYSLQPLRYGKVLIGFLEVYRTVRGNLNLRLAVSRDGGATWRHVADRQVFFPNGPERAWNYRWSTFSSNPPEVTDAELRFWCTGLKNKHGDIPNVGAIGAATLRLDGFVSLLAKHQGMLVTQPIELRDQALWINYETSPGGCIRVGLLDRSDRPISGFSLEDCRPMRGNEVREKVCWRSPRVLTSGSVKVAFKLSKAAVYSYGLAQPDAAE